MRNVNLIASMLEYAMCFIGTQYKWGGANAIEGFDCSGFIQEVLSSIGFDPPGDQTAALLYHNFLARSEPSKKGPGALVFYGPSIDKISHISMMVNEFQVIEAGGGGSRTLTREDAAAHSAVIRIRHFDARKDIVAVLMPHYPG